MPAVLSVSVGGVTSLPTTPQHTWCLGSRPGIRTFHFVLETSRVR